MNANLGTSNDTRKIVDELGKNIFDPSSASLYHDALTFLLSNFKYRSDAAQQCEVHFPAVTELIEYFHHLGKE
ncbi:MAG TPA: hypothetical protein PLI34_03535 [Saprospiraceae bacterium]|nr:hypothetical protein [Saprospiraceae bacterium]HRK80225.1 hypothetical protein [Saprospiraceae bacterium]